MLGVLTEMQHRLWSCVSLVRGLDAASRNALKCTSSFMYSVYVYWLLACVLMEYFLVEIQCWR